VERPRADPRYALEIDAEITVGDERFPARTRDLSRGGLSFHAPRPVTVGAAVGIAVSLVSEDRALSEPLALRGRVVWCTPVAGDRHQVGVSFVSLTGDQRVYLELFLRYLEDA
jgi:Tfp pilus assembly protein PilZ